MDIELSPVSALRMTIAEVYGGVGQGWEGWGVWVCMLMKGGTWYWNESYKYMCKGLLNA